MLKRLIGLIILVAFLVEVVEPTTAFVRAYYVEVKTSVSGMLLKAVVQNGVSVSENTQSAKAADHVLFVGEHGSSVAINFCLATPHVKITPLFSPFPVQISCAFIRCIEHPPLLS